MSKNIQNNCQIETFSSVFVQKSKQKQKQAEGRKWQRLRKGI